MSFLTPTLLAGIALVGLPIALHLAMRHEPQRLVFPAMRLLQRRRQQNETRLRLRRWLLLLLRCAVVALLAIALARPILKPPGSATDGRVGEGLAVAMVFDNGPNMRYQSRNQTRLEVAQETATWLLDRLPPTTDVVIADRSARSTTRIEVPDEAALRLDRMPSVDAARPLGNAVRDALARLDDVELGRRELYLFTDQSRGVWNPMLLDAIAAELETRPDVALHWVDVGVDDPHNLAVVAATPHREAIASGEPLRLRAQVAMTGPPAADATIQLWMLPPTDRADAAPVKRDERPLLVGTKTESPPDTLPNKSTTQEFRFTLRGLGEGTHRGWVTIAGGDPLAADDRRSFCVEVRPAPRVLLVASGTEQALFLREAIAPTTPDGVAPYDVQILSLGRLDRQPIDEYAAVLLLDPPPMVPTVWHKLTTYAEAGGSVALLLGRRATLDSFNSPEAQRLMPARLKWQSREATYLRPLDYSHAALRLLADYADAVPWRAFPVYRRWSLASVRESAQVVIAYADGQPALLDAAVGRGQVLLLTTPLSDPLNLPDPWNLLPTGEDPWPFLLFTGGMIDTLCDSASVRRNYVVGETVIAPLPAGFDGQGYVLRLPSGDAVRQTLLPGRRDLILGTADEAGLYQIESGSQLRRAFAMNLDPSVSELERLPFTSIEQALGEGRVHRVHDRQELAESIRLTRVGQELYAWAIGLVVLCFTAEQMVSNRFYGDTDAVEA